MISKANWSDFSSLDSSTALSAINRLLPPWVSLLLVIAIGWQIAQIIWMLVPGPAAGDNVPVPVSAAPSSVQSSTVTDVTAIANAHMFGVADQEDAPAAAALPVADENLEETRLTNLSLKGTVASARPEFSVAIIADGKDEERVYAIDEPIGSSAKLHAVYPDRVVLNENGKLTNLKLPKEFPTSQPNSVRRTTSATRQTPRNSIQSVVSNNLSNLADVIRPTPYFSNGKQVGYRVYPGRNRQQFAALGLRPGDLIKDIDGQALNDPTQAMQVFQSLGTAQQVSVTVERNGQPETIILKTSQLDLGGEQTK